MSEPRRSVRSNKGQHSKSADHDYPSLVKKPRSGKRNSKPIEPEPEPDVEESDDDAAVRCVCGATEDLGGRMMIECESCKVWQHNVCMGIPESPDDSLTFHCEQCKPDLHRELLDAMSKGEKLWETRMASVDKKRKGKRKSQGGRRTQKQVSTEEPDTEPATKRKHDGEDNSGAKEDFKRVKTDSSEPVSPPSPTDAHVLLQDLKEMIPTLIRSGQFVVPAGRSIGHVAAAAVNAIERRLASAHGVDPRHGYTAIWKTLQANSELASSILSDTPESLKLLFVSAGLEPAQPASKAHKSSEQPASLKPETDTKKEPPNVAPRAPTSASTSASASYSARPAPKPAVIPPPHPIVPKATPIKTSKDTAPKEYNSEDVKRILRISGDSLALDDIDQNSLAAIVCDPSFAFLRMLLQGTQCSVRVSGRFVGGGDFRTLYSLDRLVPKPIELNGRTPADGGDLYCSLLDPGSMDVMVCALEPLPTAHDCSRWDYVLQYYQSKSRWGVINTGTLSEPVLDMYVIPLGPTEPFPKFFQKLRFVSIAVNRTAPLLLLAIVARTRPPSGVVQPVASLPIPSTATTTTPSKQVFSPALSTPLSSIPSAVYNPAPAGTPLSAARPMPPLRPAPVGPGAASPGTPVRIPGVAGTPTVPYAPASRPSPHAPAPATTTVIAPAPAPGPSPTSAMSRIQPGANGSAAGPSPVPPPTKPPTAPAPTAVSSIPQLALDVLGPLAHLPVVAQLQQANVLPEMNVAKLQALHAVLTAHADQHTDLGQLVAFLQRHEPAGAGEGVSSRAGAGPTTSPSMVKPDAPAVVSGVKAHPAVVPSGPVISPVGAAPGTSSVPRPLPEGGGGGGSNASAVPPRQLPANPPASVAVPVPSQSPSSTSSRPPTVGQAQMVPPIPVDPTKTQVQAAPLPGPVPVAIKPGEPVAIKPGEPVVVIPQSSNVVVVVSEEQTRPTAQMQPPAGSNPSANGHVAAKP